MAENNILVAGHLQANGTVSEPATFTSIDDPTPGAWNVFSVLGSGSVFLEHTIIEYAAVGIGTVDTVGVVEMRDTVFRENSVPIVVSANNLHLLQLDNVSFDDNVRDRVFI